MPIALLARYRWALIPAVAVIPVQTARSFGC